MFFHNKHLPLRLHRLRLSDGNAVETPGPPQGSVSFLTLSLLAIMAAALIMPACGCSAPPPPVEDGGAATDSPTEFVDEISDVPLDAIDDADTTAKQAVEQVLGESADHVSVAYVPTTSNGQDRSFDIAGDARRTSASMIKLLVLAELFDEVAQGLHYLDEQVTVLQEDMVGGSGTIQAMGSGTTLSLEDLARYMITASDNVAANKLIDLMGMDAINAQAAKLGLQQTVLQRKMLDEEAARQGRENYTCANDIASMLVAIEAGTFVDATMSERALDYLKQQTDVEGISDGLPQGVVVAHKTGTLDNVEHDGGIVFADEPYILVVMTEDMGSYQALSLIGSVSQAVYEERQAA